MNLSSPSALLFSSASLERGRGKARAFSLLEVAIALVIFVFGALAIVRIFPGALRVITVGGSRQNALNLNRATLVRVQSNLPYATYDVQQGTDFGWQDGYPGDNTVTPTVPPEPRAVLGSTNRGYSLPRKANQSDVDNSALGSVRVVIGEPATVQLDTNNKPFVLTKFPIYNEQTVRVNERASLSGVTINGSGTLDFTEARWAGSDDAFTQNTGTDTYYVTFSYMDGGQKWGIVDLPTKTNSVSAPYQTSNASNTIIAGQVEVACQRQLGSIASNTTNDNGRGFLDLSGVTTQITSNGTPHQPGSPTMGASLDRVFIDYQADWQRVLQEGTADVVPERGTPATARQMILGAPFIEDADSTAILTLSYKESAAKSNLYEGRKGGWGNGVFTTDNDAPLIGGTATGPSLLSPIFADSAGRNNTSDIKGSRVTFDSNNVAGYISRVSYRTQDGWSQQLSVAAASYKPSTAVTDPPEPWRDYVLDQSNAVLYFHASEAGKSVMVTYTYNSGGASVTLRNRLLAIDDNLLTNTPVPSTFSAKRFASQLQLTDANGESISGNLLSISSVRGASVTVRTAWLDGSRYTQSFLTAMRSGTGAEAMP